MDELRLLHRENQGNLLRKHDELLQKQQTVLRLLATANHHFISEIVVVMSLVLQPVSNLVISIPDKLTIQFSVTGVTCQIEAKIDSIIRRALDNLNTYNAWIPDQRDLVNQIIGIGESNRLRLNRFSGRNTVAECILNIVHKESDKDFWNHVDKLNFFFISRPFSDRFAEYLVSPFLCCRYIRELVDRCCSAVSPEILWRLQLYIVSLLSHGYQNIEKPNNRRIIKSFRRIFWRARGLSKTACFRTIINSSNKEIILVPELTSTNLVDWMHANEDLYYAMLPLTWLSKYLDVAYLEDITDPALKQMELVLDHYNSVPW